MLKPLHLLSFLPFLPLFVFAQSADDELVRIKELIPDIVLDVRYATTDNFTRSSIRSEMPCWRVALCVNCNLYRIACGKMGLGLKIYDGYRPRDSVSDVGDCSQSHVRCGSVHRVKSQPGRRGRPLACRSRHRQGTCNAHTLRLVRAGSRARLGHRAQCRTGGQPDAPENHDGECRGIRII